jgi:regulator of RNase E activity RraA
MGEIILSCRGGCRYAGIGDLMATAMKYLSLAESVIDASVRDTPQIRKLRFQVFSRGVAPSASTIAASRASMYQ